MLKFYILFMIIISNIEMVKKSFDLILSRIKLNAFFRMMEVSLSFGLELFWMRGDLADSKEAG